jgi:hypothetical protein
VAKETKGVLHWMVPGHEASDVLTVQERLADKDASATWGYPYSDTDQAKDALFHFPDDPKTRMLNTNAAKDLTVKEFFDLLAIGEECGANKMCGVFHLALPTTHLNEQDKDTQGLDACIEFFETTALFSTRQDALDASRQLAQLLQNIPARKTVVTPPTTSKRKPTHDLVVNTLTVRKKRT